MANQYRLGNRQNEESSPRHLRYMWAINSADNLVASSTSAPRIFGSSLNMNPTIGVQARAGPAAPAGAGPAGSNSNVNSILSFNGGINTVTTTTTTAAATTTTIGTRSDDRRRANSSLKRSRTPNAINRGESSSQGSEADGSSSRRPITFPPSPIHAHQDNINNMSSSSSSTFWMNHSGNSSISTMFNHHTTNEVAAAGAGPSNTINQSQINSTVPHGPAGFFEDHNSSHYDFPTRPFDILRLLHRQEHPWTNFNAGSHNPSPASASFQYPSAAAGGAGGGGSSSRSRGWGRNYDNNLDIFDTIHEQRMNEEYVESTSWGRLNGFLAPTPTNSAGRPSSFVPPRRPPQSSDPSPSNYRRNPPPPPPPRSGNPTRPSGSNRISISTSPELRAERNTLREELFSTLQHLRNGGSVRIQDLLILDYSIVLNLLDSQELIDQLNDSEDWPYEIMSALESQMGSVETGLTEQEISRYILQETYQVNLEETCTLNQTCTICQEDYVEGERIGKLDCMHLFHLDCIKQWLEEKNVCPICKQTGLEIDESESEDE